MKDHRMNYFGAINLAAVLLFTIKPASANDARLLSQASERKESSGNLESETEHLPPISPNLRAQILKEIPAETTARFQDRPVEIVTKSETVDIEELRRFSITLDTQGKDITGVPKAAIVNAEKMWPIKFEPKEIVSYYPLTRPGESNFVAIALIIANKGAVLNPLQGFNYGPIPFLPKMTLAQADSLWGHASNNLAEEINRRLTKRTYQLTSKNQSGEIKDFSIRCLFQNGVLERYTLSGYGVNYASLGPMYFRNYQF